MRLETIQNGDDQGAHAKKLAIEGLTKAFAKALPQDMVTIALNPLLVLTNLLERYKALLLPGEYELGVTPSLWVKFVVPKMLALSEKDNRASLTWRPNVDKIPGLTTQE